MRSAMQRYWFFAIVVVAFLGCSEPKEAPLAVSSVGVHPQAWLQKGATDFHGTVLAANQFDAADCQQCHGNQFDGGLVEVSC